MAVWTVYAEWSDEEQVGYCKASDIPGLHVDAATLDRLAAKVAEHVATLLEINADLLSDPDREGPHNVGIVAHHQRAVAIAA